MRCSVLSLATEPLFAFCVPMRLPQAHSGPTAIPIDEFDAGSFKSAANSQVVNCGHRGVTFGEFSTPNRAQANG
jgi:hypothetical protein